MKRLLTMIGLGMGGLALAISLSLGAFALAGRSLGEPAAVRISQVSIKEHVKPGKASVTSAPDQHASGSPTASPADDHGGPTDGGGRPSPSPHESGDNHGGGDD